MGIFLFLFGLIIGSFLNSFLWRYQSKTTFKGRSICPSCKHQITWRDNIPVISWFLLSGRCRYCKKTISVQYPLVEIITGISFLLFGIFSKHTNTIQRWINEGFYLRDNVDTAYVIQNITGLIIGMLVIATLIAISIHDYKSQEIPNGFNLTFIILATIYLFTTSYSHLEPFRVIITAIVAGFFAFLFFWMFVFFSKETWMGGGDAKLAIGIGLLLGPINTFLAILLASWLGSIYGISVLVREKSKKKTLSHQIPFGPFLAIGTFLSLLFGSQLTLWYAKIFLGI